MTQGTFLFIGDGFIADFDWQQRMPHFTLCSHGITNEHVAGLLHRLPIIERAVPPPDIILIMTGINNVIAGDYTFVDQIRRGVIRLSNHYPNAEIIINSLPNIDAAFLVEEAIYHLNTSLNTMARQTGSCYLDNFAKISTDRTIFREDGTRLTTAAYDRWARAILEYVAFLLEDD